MIFRDYTLTVANGIVTLTLPTSTPINPQEFEAPLHAGDMEVAVVQRMRRLIGFEQQQQLDDTSVEEDLKLLGKLLFNMLFSGSAKDRSGRDLGRSLGKKFVEQVAEFEREVDANRNSDLRFRLNLMFKGGPDLQGLPWEFLYITTSDEDGFFMTVRGDRLVLTRVIPPALNPPTVNYPLTIWIAWAHPKELGPISSNPQNPEQGIIDEIAKWPKLFSEPRIFPQVTRKDLKDALEAVRKNGGPGPDILHFIGHGAISDKRTEIALRKSVEDLRADQGRANQTGHNPDAVPEADWQSGSDVAALFEKKQQPWLFVLQACNTAKATSTVATFRTVAQELAREGVHSVVAMQDEVGVEDAQTFAKNFYEEFCKTRSIDNAVWAGRQALGTQKPSWRHSRFALPVVYIRGSHPLLPLEVPPPQDESAGAKRSTKQDCPHPKCGDLVTATQVTCSCKRHIRLKSCANGHQNLVDADECTECEAPFELTSPVKLVPPASASGGPIAG